VCRCVVEGYFWAYDATTVLCDVRATSTFSQIWSWSTEMFIFLVVPLAALFLNVLVIVEVRRISKSSPSSDAVSRRAAKSSSKSLTSRKNSQRSRTDSSSSTATTVMLLSVSFYVIATTLPATLVYVLESEFPEGDRTMNDLEISQDPTWSRYLGYILSRKVVEEICLSHYACNIVLYVVTGAHFRRALLELLSCRKQRQHSTEYSEITVRAPTPCTTAL